MSDLNLTFLYLNNGKLYNAIPIKDKWTKNPVFLNLRGELFDGNEYWRVFFERKFLGIIIEGLSKSKCIIEIKKLYFFSNIKNLNLKNKKCKTFKLILI